MVRPQRFIIILVFLLTLGSGLLNLYSVANPVLPARLLILSRIFPLDFVHLTRFLTLLSGFALVIFSVNIYRRKRRAWNAVLLVSILSIIFHLSKGLDYEEATLSLILTVLLLFTRPYFTVKSSIPNVKRGIWTGILSIFLATSYGIAGFWFLDKKEFGINFHIGQSVMETFKFLIFTGDSQLVPHTHHAVWFLNSLYVITITAFIVALIAFFRPVIFKYGTLPRERHQARFIVEQYGKSAMDYFKYWPDKSIFFSPSEKSFISYGVANHFAIALADPTGPADEIENIIGDFKLFCQDNGWRCGFHQTLPDYLPLYEKKGFRHLKLGDDAIVDLTDFNLEGKKRKDFRYVLRKMEELGIRLTYFDPPLKDEVLSQLKEISDEWLQIPGRRERQFTLGYFELNYIRTSPVYAAVNAEGNILAFLNQIPSYLKGETSIDLMRRRSNSPNGIMDFLFIATFLDMKQKGYTRFNLGMAPMSGFQPDEEASLEEKAIHYFFQHLNFIFSYQGLKAYKAKFASFWEPRYSIYQYPLDLPRMILALREVSEVKKGLLRELEQVMELKLNSA